MTEVKHYNVLVQNKGGLSVCSGFFIPQRLKLTRRQAASLAIIHPDLYDRDNFLLRRGGRRGGRGPVYLKEGKAIFLSFFSLSAVPPPFFGGVGLGRTRPYVSKVLTFRPFNQNTVLENM